MSSINPLRNALLASLAVSFQALPSTAFAQAYPTRSITMVVPFAAGGPTDAVARVVAEHMGRTLGQQFVIENVAGAGGTTGTTRVAQAKPDGYSVLLHHSGITAAPALYANLRYDSKTAFETIGLVNSGPMLMLAKKASPYKDLKEMLAALKATPDKVTLAHAGVGANSYLCGLLVQKIVGVKLAFVPYTGTGPAMNDLVGGQIDGMCDQSTSVVPQVAGGSVKAFAVAAAQRIDSIKDIPTATEAGVPEFQMTVWHGIYAPKDTPKELVGTLNGALQKALSDEAIVQKFAAVGTQIFPRAQWSPEAHKTKYLADIQINDELLKSAGAKPQDAK